MDIRPIRTDADHAEALKEIERLWGAGRDTAEGDKLEILATLVNAYEDQRWPIGSATPLEVLRHAIDEAGFSQAELAELLGSRSRASEILSGRRRISIDAAHKISTAWHIPAELLIQPYELRAA